MGSQTLSRCPGHHSAEPGWHRGFRVGGEKANVPAAAGKRAPMSKSPSSGLKGRGLLMELLLNETFLQSWVSAACSGEAILGVMMQVFRLQQVNKAFLLLRSHIQVSRTGRVTGSNCVDRSRAK